MTTPPSDKSAAEPSPPAGTKNEGRPAKARLKIAINRIVDRGEPIDSEATKRLLAEIIANFGQNADEGGGWNPYADGDPNILIGAKGSDRV